MASTPAHGFLGGYIMWAILRFIIFILYSLSIPLFVFLALVVETLVVPMVVLAASASMLPDVVGDLEPEEEGEEKRWNWYVIMHSTVARWAIRKWYYGYTFFIWLHVYVDQYFHDKFTGKWTPQGYILECLLWMMFAILYFTLR